MKNKTSFLITAAGTTQEVKPHGDRFTNKELQMLVGSFVDIINLEDGMAMVLAEDGVRNGLPANYLATLAGKDFLDGPALGDVVILPADMVEGR